jgi:mannose-6-phosphate isomerase-like protein (cupin superfamily)
MHTDHMYANANYGFADPNDPANPNRGNAAGRGRGRGAGAGAGSEASARPFDPRVPGGHLHPGNVEWWIVLTGHISGKFETGSYIGEEGDVMYAPPHAARDGQLRAGWFSAESPSAGHNPST